MEDINLSSSVALFKSTSTSTSCMEGSYRTVGVGKSLRIVLKNSV